MRGFGGNKIRKPHTTTLVPSKITSGKYGSVAVSSVSTPCGGSDVVAAPIPKKISQFARIIGHVFTSWRGSTKTLNNFVKVNFSTSAFLDLGTTTSKIAVYGGQGRQVVVSASSGVSFTPDCRVVVGDEAMIIKHRGAKLIFAIRLLLGKQYKDPVVQQLTSRFPCDYTIVQGSDGEALVEAYGQRYSPVQIIAILICHLKKRAEASLGEPLSMVTLTVPPYFDEAQKKALLQASKLASFEVDKIELEPIRAARCYGLLEKSRKYVVVIDCGGGGLDVTLLEINESGVQVKVANSDLFLGGLDLNKQLLDYYVGKIQEKYGMDFGADIRALQKFSKVIEDSRVRLSTQLEVSLKFSIATSFSGWRIPQVGFKELNYIPTEPGLKEHSVIGETQHLKLAGEGLEYFYGMPFANLLSKFRFRSMKILKFELSRSELETQMKGFVEKAQEVCFKTIFDGGLEVKDIDQALLVGGMGNAPILEAGFRAIFEKKLIKGDTFATIFGSSPPTTSPTPSPPLYKHLWRGVQKSLFNKFSKFKIQTLDDECCRSQAIFFENYRVETKALIDTKIMLFDVCSEARKGISNLSVSEAEKEKLKSEISEVEKSMDELEEKVYKMLRRLWITSKDTLK